MNKRIRKKQRERARRESAERYRQNPTIGGLCAHFNHFGEVLTPMPDISEPMREAAESAKQFAAWLADKLPDIALTLVQIVEEYLMHGPRFEPRDESAKEPIGLIHQREDESE